MKRELIVALAGVAVVVAGLSGCSKDEGSKSSSSSSSAAGTGVPSVAAGDSTSKVTIDGKEHKVEGTTVCTTVAGKINLAIGAGPTGVSAVLTDATPPTVEAVGLGNVDGVTLAYAAGSGQGKAEAKKDGNTYTITGDATGVDMANPTSPVTKSFEITVNCP